MKNIDLQQLETIDLQGWQCIEKNTDKEVYQKGSLEKHLLLQEDYTLEQNFQNGQLQGFTVGRMHSPFLHYPNPKSCIYLVEQFEQGLQTGKSLQFYEDGTREEMNWLNNQLHGQWAVWYNNGQLQKKEHYLHGKLNGQQCEWFENGQLQLQEHFSDGLLEGESNQYLENGWLKSKKYYQAGKIEGEVYTLWINKFLNNHQKKIYSLTPYQNDVPHGEERVYFPDGSKMRVGFYDQGVLQGARTWWHENGQVSIQEYFVEDELEGERKLYDEQGQLESVQYYVDGQLQ